MRFAEAGPLDEAATLIEREFPALEVDTVTDGIGSGPLGGSSSQASIAIAIAMKTTAKQIRVLSFGYVMMSLLDKQYNPARCQFVAV